MVQYNIVTEGDYVNYRTTTLLVALINLDIMIKWNQIKPATWTQLRCRIKLNPEI